MTVTLSTPTFPRRCRDEPAVIPKFYSVCRLPVLEFQMRGGRPARDVKALTFDNNRTELAGVSTRRLEATESGKARGTKRGAQPTSVDKVVRAKALSRAGRSAPTPNASQRRSSPARSVRTEPDGFL
jgi:hypothetical protein